MKTVAGRNIPREKLGTVATLEKLGVVTGHEAQGRTGLVKLIMRPINPPIYLDEAA